jgi:hypothetical protein
MLSGGRTRCLGEAAPCANVLSSIPGSSRLYHVLYWAQHVRPSKGDRIPSCALLGTERGLDRLLARGCMTRREHELLTTELLLPKAARPAVILEWIGTRIVAARKQSIISGGAGFEQLCLEKLLLLRSVSASIDDDEAARMPLAYVHLVQILVDALVVLAPFALYAKLGVFMIPCVGMQTIFYRGFLVLSKSFLDPFGNEDSLSENFNVHCLIRETNAGSIKWSRGIELLPFDSETGAQVHAEEDDGTAEEDGSTED